MSQEQIHKDIRQYVIDPVVPEGMIDENTKIFINPTGRFVIGGPHGDSGLTGRKIIVDTADRTAIPVSQAARSSSTHTADTQAMAAALSQARIRQRSTAPQRMLPAISQRTSWQQASPMRSRSSSPTLSA